MITLGGSVACTGLALSALLPALAPRPLGARQQAPPLVAASLDLLPYSNLENPRAGTAEEDLRVRVTNPRLEANLPVPIGGGGVLVYSLRYSLLDFDYRDAPIPAGAPERLHDVSVRVALSTPLSSRWRLLVAAQPGLASDFEELSSDHLRFQSAVIFTRRLGSATTLGIGGVLQNNFGEPLPLPVLNLHSRSGPWRLDLQLPRSAGLYLGAGERAEAGVVARVDGGFYRLGGAPAAGHRVRYSVISAGPTFRLRLARRATLRVDGGGVFIRRFEVQDDTAAELRSIELEPGWYGRVGLELIRWGTS